MGVKMSGRLWKCQTGRGIVMGQLWTCHPLRERRVGSHGNEKAGASRPVDVLVLIRSYLLFVAREGAGAMTLGWPWSTFSSHPGWCNRDYLRAEGKHFLADQRLPAHQTLSRSASVRKWVNYCTNEGAPSPPYASTRLVQLNSPYWSVHPTPRSPLTLPSSPIRVSAFEQQLQL